MMHDRKICSMAFILLLILSKINYFPISNFIDLKIRYFKTMSKNKRQTMADTVESIFRNSILIALYGNTLNTRIQI